MRIPLSTIKKVPPPPNYSVDIIFRDSELYNQFYDNCKNSRSYWLIFIFNKRTDTWIHALRDASTSESEQFDNLLSEKKIIDVCIKNKKCTHVNNFFVSCSCVCPVIDNSFRHNIVKVVCECTATVTMLWRNSWSITGQTHGKTEYVNLLTAIFKVH